MGQIHVAGYTATLGQYVKTDQDVLNLIPKNAVKTTEPKIWDDLNAGDYVFVKYPVGSALLLVHRKLPTGILAKAIALTDSNEWDIGDIATFSTISRISSSATVYRPSVGDSGGISKGTLILGGLALAAIVGGVVYFSTR